MYHILIKRPRFLTGFIPDLFNTNEYTNFQRYLMFLTVSIAFSSSRSMPFDSSSSLFLISTSGIRPDSDIESPFGVSHLAIVTLSEVSPVRSINS